MKKAGLFVLLLFLSYHVNALHLHYNTVVQNTSNGENFELFFKRFNTDKAFQLSRIVFPFKIISAENEKSPRIPIAKARWQYINLLAKTEKKIIIKKTIKSRDEVIINYQIDDTGVSVDHIFHQDNGQWKLIRAVDYSD